MISLQLQESRKNIDLLSSEDDFRDFNAKPTETAVYDFCKMYYLANLVKEKNMF